MPFKKYSDVLRALQGQQSPFSSDCSASFFKTCSNKTNSQDPAPIQMFEISLGLSFSLFYLTLKCFSSKGLITMVIFLCCCSIQFNAFPKLRIALGRLAIQNSHPRSKGRCQMLSNEIWTPAKCEAFGAIYFNFLLYNFTHNSYLHSRYLFPVRRAECGERGGREILNSKG